MYRASAMHGIERSAGDSAGKTASRQKSSGVRFSATQADGTVGSDTVGAGVVLSLRLQESRGGCAAGKEVIMLPESSVPALCETLPLRLLFCCKKIRVSTDRGPFFNPFGALSK